MARLFIIKESHEKTENHFASIIEGVGNSETEIPDYDSNERY